MPQFFEKSSRFPENLFQSESIENVWNFHWLSRKNRPISQTEGFFENTYYCFSEEPMLFLLALKWKLSEKTFSNVKTKTNSSVAVKVTERSNHSFLLYTWWIKFFKTFVRIDCVAVGKTSEAANFVFQWIFPVKYKFCHVSIVKEVKSPYFLKFSK